MSRRASSPSDSHIVRDALDKALDTSLACLDSLEEKRQREQNLAHNRFALDGIAALALFARGQEREHKIHLRSRIGLTHLLEQRGAIAVDGTERAARYLKASVRLELGLSQDKDLNFRAIDSSSFNECMVEVLYERPASTRRFIPTVHPSSLLLSTLNRISSARQPLDADLDLLVAIYWLEEDSRTVLQADTFVDLKRIRHLDVFGFVEDNLQALTERMRSKLVVDYAKKVSIERFHRELGRDYLVNMIRDLFQGRMSLEHPGTRVAPTDIVFQPLSRALRLRIPTTSATRDRSPTQSEDISPTNVDQNKDTKQHSPVSPFMRRARQLLQRSTTSTTLGDSNQEGSQSRSKSVGYPPLSRISSWSPTTRMRNPFGGMERKQSAGNQGGEGVRRRT
ncbi:hypothetical protein JCM5353_008349 [Sporobolomyces roseus]